MRNLNNKANRIELQNYFFESLVKNGFTREDYKDLIIWTNPAKLEYRIFRGTSTKHLCYYRTKSVESMAKAVQDYKNSADRRESYKAEVKANPTKSTSANCAVAIRTELKESFPDVKFSVKSDNFAGGDAVRISWTDGPTDEQVNSITKKYQYGRFDGMTDMYEYSNTDENLPQSKYVQTSRTISDEVNEVVFNALKERFADGTADYVINQDKYRLISNTSIPFGAIVTGIESTKDCGSIEDCFRLTLDVTNVKQAKKQAVEQKPQFEAVEVPAGTVQIIEYSAKAIAVIGETKAIKEGLKDLGGKFNFRLSCGAGWIFSKTKLEAVTAFLSSGGNQKNDNPSADVLAQAMETEETNAGLVKTVHDGKRDKNGAFNIECHKTVYDHSGRDITELEKSCREARNVVAEEVQKTIQFLADLDIQNTGEVSESVKECARVQNVDLYKKNGIEIYDSVEDLENAVQGGKVISLLNLSNLVNNR